MPFLTTRWARTKTAAAWFTPAAEAKRNSRAIPVETGMETDYYIEISGEGLSDGMEVKTSANDTATAAAGADDAQQSGENAMFSMDMGGGHAGR